MKYYKNAFYDHNQSVMYLWTDTGLERIPFVPYVFTKSDKETKIKSISATQQ